ncbi:hypothetical protein D3C86_1823350 [compost metagenome]
MTIEISKSNLDLLYNKARASFGECIDLKENEFLQQEVDIPLKSIILREKDIKIVFSPEIPESFTREVYLKLYSGNIEIGKYLYIEDKDGNPIDDSLVFY